MMLTRPYVDLPFGGWPLLALRIAAVLLLADASYRLVEIPIRGGAWRPAVWQVMALTARVRRCRPRTGSSPDRFRLPIAGTEARAAGAQRFARYVIVRSRYVPVSMAAPARRSVGTDLCRGVRLAGDRSAYAAGSGRGAGVLRTAKLAHHGAHTGAGGDERARDRHRHLGARDRYCRGRGNGDRGSRDRDADARAGNRDADARAGNRNADARAGLAADRRAARRRAAGDSGSHRRRRLHSRRFDLGCRARSPAVVRRQWHRRPQLGRADAAGYQAAHRQHQQDFHGGRGAAAGARGCDQP